MSYFINIRPVGPSYSMRTDRHIWRNH